MADDWMQDIANEIIEDHEPEPFEGYYHKIIAKHSPFKPDVAYMPVPRCEACAHWKLHKHATIESPGHYGQCMMPATVANIQSTHEGFGCVQWKEKG